MTHIAASLFFSVILVGACAMLHLLVKEHWQEMLTALAGSPDGFRPKVHPMTAPPVGRPRPAAS